MGNWEQQRQAEIEAGRENLPADKLHNLSVKQQEYYLSLRGQFRKALAILLVQYNDRIKAAYASSLPSVYKEQHAKGIEAAGKVMRLFDSVAAYEVMRLKITSIGILTLLGLAGEVKEAMEILR